MIYANLGFEIAGKPGGDLAAQPILAKRGQDKNV